MMRYTIRDGKEKETTVNISDELIKTAAADPDIDWNVVMRRCRETLRDSTQAVKPEPITADEQMVRAAILDVIDSGPAPTGGFQWRFYKDSDWTDDQVDRDRCGFADHVIARARELKRPDNSADHLATMKQMDAFNAQQEAAKAWEEVGAFAERYRHDPSTKNAMIYMGLVTTAIKSTGKASRLVEFTVPKDLLFSQVWSDIGAIQGAIIGCEYEKIARLHRKVAKEIYNPKVGAA